MRYSSEVMESLTIDGALVLVLFVLRVFQKSYLNKLMSTRVLLITVPGPGTLY